MSHPVNFALYRREILVTKAAFFCVLTKMPYECQTWICMPVVMLLCCTINWSVTKRSRCVCSFIYGGCNILKFCIPTKKKNLHLYRLWCCSFSQVCGFEPTPWKTCSHAVWLKWVNYTARFLLRWGLHSKVQGASEWEAAWGMMWRWEHLILRVWPTAGICWQEKKGAPVKRSRE